MTVHASKFAFWQILRPKTANFSNQIGQIWKKWLFRKYLQVTGNSATSQSSKYADFLLNLSKCANSKKVWFLIFFHQIPGPCGSRWGHHNRTPRFGKAVKPAFHSRGSASFGGWTFAKKQLKITEVQWIILPLPWAHWAENRQISMKPAKFQWK